MKIMMAYFEKFIDVSGGIEHMLSALANELVKRGHEVSVVYCYGKSGKCFYPLDPSIRLYNLMAIHPEKWKDPSLGQCISGMTKLKREIIRTFSPAKARDYNESVKGNMIAGELQQVVGEIQPDVIVSLRYETSNYIINCAKIHIPVVTRSFMNPEFMLKNAPAGEIRAIQKSAAVHVLVKRDKPVMEKMCPGAKVVWIPNPVPQYEKQADLGAAKKVHTIINIARLNKAQKQQHLLVQAFSRLAKDYPDWQVEIWGGENDVRHGYTDELHQMIKDLHVENQVFLKGESHDVEKEYMKSDIFCFPSAYEGFGNSLAEAMSAGLPPVVFKSCPAVGELVHDHVNGLQCADGVDGLTQALKELMDSKEERIRLGNAARESMEQYSPKRVFDQWEQVIKEAAARGAKI